MQDCLNQDKMEGGRTGYHLETSRDLPATLLVLPYVLVLMKDGALCTWHVPSTSLMGGVE